MNYVHGAARLAWEYRELAALMAEAAAAAHAYHLEAQAYAKCASGSV